jgi:hypothetical protein
LPTGSLRGKVALGRPDLFCGALQEAALVAEAGALAAELARVAAEGREAEAALRSKKKSSEKEVAVWLAEYDRDMSAKDKENRENKVIPKS